MAPLTTWLEPAARTLAIAEPTTRQEYFTSIATVVARPRSGSPSPGPSTAARAAPVPSVPSLQRALEHKFYFDELYDRLFYRPAAALATLAAAATSRSRVILADRHRARPDRARRWAASCRRLQTGLLRTYVFFARERAPPSIALVFLLTK